MMKRYLSRRIELVDSEGNLIAVHNLSIATVHDGGRLEITPFERETAGVEYVDSTLVFRIEKGRIIR
ncbi:MAG: hypothetical protein K2O24_05885 [Muribaculaceae bacterium]|nr:hypothetical protein [Muribaculaceae bacterium]